MDAVIRPLVHAARSTLEVLRACHRLQVFGVHAGTVSAQVVQVETCGYLSHHVRVERPVGHPMLPSEDDLAVPVPSLRPGPQPAFARLGDLIGLPPIDALIHRPHQSNWFT